MAQSHPTEKTPFIILVADQHPGVRQSLKRFLETQSDTVVMEAPGGHQGLLALIQRRKPDLILLDLALNHGVELDILVKLRQAHPALRILVLSLHSEQIYAERAIRAGANGYLMKKDLPGRLLPAVNCIRANKTFVSPAIQNPRTENAAPGDGPPRSGKSLPASNGVPQTHGDPVQEVRSEPPPKPKRGAALAVAGASADSSSRLLPDG